MARRVCIGARGDGNIGLFVSRSGIDVLSDDLADRTKFAFSSSWGDTVGIIMSGTVVGETWVSLPAVCDYWPVVQFDRIVSASQYASPLGAPVNIPGRAAFVQALDFCVVFQTVGSVRQFRVTVVSATTAGGTAASFTFRYIVTTLKVA